MSSKKTRAVVDAIQLRSGQGREEKPERNHNLLEQRSRSIQRAGETESVLHKRIDPARCRIWSGNARDYEQLTYERCEGLINALLSQGKQEIPAIARPLRDDPDYDFEAIVGARRHWSITWIRKNKDPDFKFFIELRDIETDEEAFRLSDIENRDREDVSAYERAKEYQQALKEFYDGDRAKMASRLEINRSTLSRYLMLADLPETIIKAFASPLEVTLPHAQQINSLIKTEESKKQVMEAAKTIAERQSQARKEGRQGLSSKEVVKELKQSVGRSNQKTPKANTTIENPKGNTLMRVEAKGRYGYRVFVTREKPDMNDFLEGCRTLYEELYGQG